MDDHTPHKALKAWIVIDNDDGDPCEEIPVHIDAALVQSILRARKPQHLAYLRDAVLWVLNEEGDHRLSLCHSCMGFYDAPFDAAEPGAMLLDAIGVCPSCAPYYTPPVQPLPYKKAPIPPALRRAVFERDGYRCQHCGGWDTLGADHIVPESKGGPTTFDNLQTLCRSCNSRKGARV